MGTPPDCAGSYNGPMGLPLDVCVRGGGIVGRALALLLAQERLRVGLVESPEAVGAAQSDLRAYAINASSRALLDQVRSWPEALAMPVQSMAVFGDAGGQVRFNDTASGEGPPTGDGTANRSRPLAWIVRATDLLGTLDQALHYQPQVERLTAPQPAALTVVCEGKASATRTELGVDWRVQPYYQHAIAAQLRAERPHAQVARQWFRPGEILALLPMGGPMRDAADPGTGAVAGHALALVWSVPAERAAELAALPVQAFEDLLQEATGGKLGRISLTTERVRWPLQRAEASRWCGPGWALAGDAAHTVHPLAGQGLNLGLADAGALVQILRDREYWRQLGDERLLRRYERARKGEVAAMQWTTGGLQWLFAPPGPAWRFLRNWGMRGFEHSGPLKNWVARQAAGGL